MEIFSIVPKPSLTSELLFLMLIAFFVGTTFGVFLFVFLGRAVYGVFRPILRLFRFLFSPIRFVLRKMRILRWAAAETRPARNALVSAIERGGLHTELEKALRYQDAIQTDEQAEEGAIPDDASSYYDFTVEESILQRGGTLFTRIRIPGDYIPESLTSHFTPEVAEEYRDEAGKFFGGGVTLEANPHALYEDVEGAIIVSMFRRSDRRCFYALDQLRRVVNNNALKLIIVLGAGFLLSVFLTWELLSLSALEDSSSSFLSYFRAYAAPLAISVPILVTTGMFVIQNSFYAQQQQHNMRELTRFLSRYLDRISDRYRDASATASRVTQGDETDSKKLAHDARKWFKITMWMPFRSFFIECFVRNTYFQIRRNTDYYLILSWILFVLFVGISGLFLFYWISPQAENVAVEWWVIAASVLVLGNAVSFIAMVGRTVLKEELNQVDWLGYDNLDMGRQMDEVIGKYAEDVGFWKGRFER